MMCLPSPQNMGCLIVSSSLGTKSGGGQNTANPGTQERNQRYWCKALDQKCQCLPAGIRAGARLQNKPGNGSEPTLSAVKQDLRCHSHSHSTTGVGSVLSVSILLTKRSE